MELLTILDKLLLEIGNGNSYGANGIAGFSGESLLDKDRVDVIHILKDMMVNLTEGSN